MTQENGLPDKIFSHVKCGSGGAGTFTVETRKPVIPAADPLSREECEKFADINIRLNDDGSYGYSRSGALDCKHVFNCIRQQCSGIKDAEIDEVSRWFEEVVEHNICWENRQPNHEKCVDKIRSVLQKMRGV